MRTLLENLRDDQISRAACFKCGGRYLSNDIGQAINEIERLQLENWQLKGALGYPVPGNVPPGDFKCGLCEARRMATHNR